MFCGGFLLAGVIGAYGIGGSDSERKLCELEVGEVTSGSEPMG